MKATITVDQERCKGCELCIAACPKHILQLSPTMVNQKGYNFAILLEAEECTGCKSCAIACPDACITVYRAKQ